MKSEDGIQETEGSVNRRTPLPFGSGVHGCGGRIWTAELWVMRSDSPFDESRTVPSSTRDARHPVSTPSPTIPGAWFGIALSLTRCRFHRLWRV